jgi:hypothetical protein
MGGDYDVVVLAVVVNVGRTDGDGYRDAVLDVGVVLRGTAPRDYHVAYPASMDEPRVTFLPGATYLVAIQSDGITGGPTTGPCSATKRIVEAEEIARYISLATDPTIYREDLPVLADDEPEQERPVPIIVAGAAAVLLLTLVAWMFIGRRAPHS